MASSTIKGLTVEIGGDTTKLGKALDDVQKQSQNLSGELGQVNKLLKLDPGNAELLAQKQKILANAIEDTGKKLDILKEAEKQVQAQFEKGEVSEGQVRALQREIIDTTKKMEQYEAAAKSTADALDKLGKESEETEEEVGDLSESLSDIGGKGMTSLVASVAGATAALTGSAEATREYRVAMGKLDTAFTTAGHSSETATKTYKELQGVLGESDQAVEAANHLAKLAGSEEDLANWTKIATGVYATFGDSLPIEGLTEAANESIRTGQVTGALADALNWAAESGATFGVGLKENIEFTELSKKKLDKMTEAQRAEYEARKEQHAAIEEYNKRVEEATTAEDKFNIALENCTTEQERQELITKTLNGLYSEAAGQYRETNAEVIAANEANEEWTAGLAEVGAEVEPLLTKVKELGGELLRNLVPAVRWILDNLPTIGIALAGLTATVISFKIAAIAAKAATEGMTLAQYAAAKAQKLLNLVLKGNPIGLVIVAITALVTAFKVLWDNCEGFRNFWIGLWKGVKEAAKAVADWFKNAWSATVDWFKNAWSAVGSFFSGLWSGIQNAAQGVIDWFVTAWTTVTEFFSTIATWVYENIIAPIGEFFVGLWNGIVEAYHTVIDPWIEIFKRIAAIVDENIIQPIVGFFQGLWESVSGFFSSLWDDIVGIWSSVSTWFDENVIQPVVEFFRGLWESVSGFFSNLWDDMVGVWSAASTWFDENVIQPVVGFFDDAWGALVTGAEGAWSGVKKAFGAVATWFSDIFSDAWDAVVKVFSTTGEVFLNIGTGILDALKLVVNAIIDGLNTVIALPFKGLNGILDKISAISILGVEPFSWLTWRAPVPQIPKLATGGVLEKGQVGLLEGSGAEAVVPLERNEKWLSRVARDLFDILDDEVGGLNGLALERSFSGAYSTAAAEAGSLVGKLDQILEAIESGHIIALDGDTLVGATLDRFDQKLGQRRILAARGAL